MFIKNETITNIKYKIYAVGRGPAVLQVSDSDFLLCTFYKNYNNARIYRKYINYYKEKKYNKTYITKIKMWSVTKVA